MRYVFSILSAFSLFLLLVGCGPSKHRPIDVYLTVQSEHGDPVPPVGDNHLNYGMTITAFVDSPLVVSEGTHYACTGWTGTGSVPPSGSANSVTFVITKNSSITYLWQAQYYLTVVSLYGNPQGAGWYDEGVTANWSVSSPWPPDPTGTRYITDSASGSVIMNSPQTVAVTWTTQYELTIEVLPEGSGTIERSLDAIYYDADTSVWLTAVPNERYVFTEWGGALTGTTNPQDLTIDSPKNVTANFALLAIYVDGANGQDTYDGLTWETAIETIQTGLNIAPDGWTVLVANGTYTGAGNTGLDFAGKAIHLQSVGGAENCIIDCGTSSRCFYFDSGETSASIVEGFTIENGNADYGGAIHCLSSSPTIINCTLSGNSAAYDGGAVYCWDSSPTIINCTFSGNSAEASGGAASCREYSSPTITDCIFSGNSADWYGGAASCRDYSNPTITNCTFNGNSAGACGGAVDCYYSSPTITNCTFSGNSASDWGGAVSCYSYSAPTITNCTLSENLGDFGGGAVYCYNYASLTITNCTLSGNSAEYYGGAVYCDYYASPTIENSILWDNSAASGGEIYIYDSESSVTLNNSDVTPGGYGGYIGNITENECIYSDPFFMNAAGGNYRLQATSPCINRGNNSYVAGVTTDLDGNPRIYPEGGTVDMGAYEYQP